MKLKWNLLVCVLLLAVLLSASAWADDPQPLPAPQFSVTGTTYARGELMSATLSEVAGADYYRVEAVASGSTESIYMGRSISAGSIWLSTARLEAGSYTLKAFAMIETGEVSEDGQPLDIKGQPGEASVTVTPYAETAPIIIRMSQTQTAPTEWTRVSIYAPGALFVELITPDDPELDWGANGDYWDYNITMTPGSHRIGAEAYFADGSVVMSDEVTLQVVEPASVGTLGDPVMELADPTVATAGQDLTVTYSFGPEDNTAGIQVAYGWTLTNVFSGRVVSQNENLSPAGGTFVVDGSLLEESQEYILELYTKTEAEGYLDKAQDVQLLVVPAAGSADLSLTCNGQTEIEIPNHTNIRLNIHAPGATGLRFYTGKGDEWYPYEVWERLLNDVHWDWEHWTEGNFALYVKACYDEDPYDEAAEWIASAPVLIHVTVPEGRLSKPQFVVPQQVTIGGILEIDNITLDQGAEWCWAELYPVGDNGRVDWEEQLAFCDILNGSIYFPTDRLLPGHSYMISMTCSGPGYLDSRSAYQAFTAVGQAPADPTYFHIINPNVVTNEYVTAMGYVPGASHIRVYIDGDLNNYWIMEDDDSFSTSWWRFDESGDHTVTLSALYAEEWESWSEWVDIATRTIHVTAPNGELNLYSWMAPSSWTEGNDWSLTFEATQADTIWFDMWKERDDRWHWTYDSEEILNLTVPGSILTEGVYHYHVHLTKRGYEGKTINGTLVVTGNVLDANLTLSVTPDEVECGEEFTVQASAPGATAIGIWIPEHNDYLEAVDSLTVTDSIGWEGEFVVFARACYDPLPDDPDLYGEDMNWGSFSQVQTLTVSAPYGAAGLPTVSGLSAGDLIPWGSDVSLTVSGGTGAASYDLHVYHEEDGGEDRLNAYIEEDEFGSGGSCTMSTYDMDPGPYVLEIYVHGLQGYSANSMRIPFTVQGEGPCGRITPSLLANSVERGDFLQIDLPYAENAVWYDVHVRDENWNEYAYARYPKNGSYDIPTAELTEGTYLVMVSTGAPGYTWNETRFQDAPRFTVTEPAGEVLNFSVSRTQVAPSENYQVSVYAPGADQIILLENGRNAGSRDSDAYAELRWWGKAGTYAYQALVHYPADGSLEERWESTSTIHVQVGDAGTEPIDIAQLAFTMPDRIQPGDDLLLSWQNIGLYHYDLNIWDDQEGRHVWHCWNHHGETSVLVPAVMPDHCPTNVEDMFAPGESIFEEGKIYQVSIEFSQIGYESVRFNRQLLVLPNSTQAMSLTVNGSQTEVTVPVHTNAQVLLDAPAGATAALAFNGYGWEWLNLDEEGDTEVEWSWWDTTRRFLFARYTTDAVDGRSWEDYAWSDPSNLVTVQPTITGNAPAPEVTMPSSVPVGTDVTFTVSNTSDLNGYMWDVYSPVEEWEWGWEDWNGLSEQTFSTRNLRIGQTYVLNVQSHGGPGLEETAVQRLFTVTGQGVMPDALGLLPATVERGAMLELTLTNLEQLRGYEGLWLSAAPYDPLEDMWFGGKYGWEGGNTICIPTSNLEVRSEPYTLYLDCGAVGWENSCSEFSFVVTEPSGPVMSLGRATVETMEDIPFSFYVPGASEITVTINEEEGWTWDSVWIMDSWGGEYAEGDWLNFDRTGTYQLRLYARYGSGDWEYTGQSTSVQVTGERLDLVIDSVLQPGEDFLIPLPAGITRVDAEIFDDTEDGLNIFWKNWEAGRRGDYNQFDYHTQEWVAPDGGDCLHSTSGEIRIPSGYLQTNHTYRIDLHMSGRGYERKDVYGQQFSVVNGTDARVTMTVTLQDSSRNPLVNEQFQVRAYAENAAAIRVFDG
ncbi:MAG: hypothetical protein K6A68_08425, partial [Clostridiales bacterium]|nr:hypothetical protein [Clostridiales bacterium]